MSNHVKGWSIGRPTAMTSIVIIFLALGWSCQLSGQVETFGECPDVFGTFASQADTPTQFQIGDTPSIDNGASDIRIQQTNRPTTSRQTEASGPRGPQPLVLYTNDRLKVTGHFQAGVNAIAESHVYWDLADFAAPTADFDSNPEWLEAYIKPGISFERTGASGLASYGKLSAVVSGTLEIDAFDRGNTGRTLFEEGYLGIRSQPHKKDYSWDVSFGPRELKLGTGMLIANGGQNGFERGALKFGPRRAWEFAATGKFRRKRLTTTLFYLDANELNSNDTATTLSGMDLRLENKSENYFGTTFIYVPTSDSPYPKAAPVGFGPPVILPGAREALNAVNSYLRLTPLQRAPDVFVAADFAYQHNDRIDLQAWGGRIQAGKTLANLPWKPKLVYSYQTFSGDDPGTTRLERFDPLFFEGSPSSWATGSKSALVFINSNVSSHQLALVFNTVPGDTITFRYAHINANELFSPLQFGQATRVELENGISTVISGVADKHVSDDVFIEFNRVLDANTFLNAGVSVSFPGTGIELVAPGQTPVWPGAFLNLVVNY